MLQNKETTPIIVLKHFIVLNFQNFDDKTISYSPRCLIIIIIIIIVWESVPAGYCWRSRDELISDVLLWTPTHGRAKAGRPAPSRTYIQQLCEDRGCCPEYLPEAMNDREKWRERVRDIRATSTT